MSTAALAAQAQQAAPTTGAPLQPPAVPAPAQRSAEVSAPTTRRRRRIDGTTTDPLGVRACSGTDLDPRPRLHLVPAPTRVHRPAGRQPVAEIEPSALQLTRRGRAVLTTLSVLIFGAAIAVLGLRVAGALDPEPQFTRTVQVQVGAGDTLWSIAQSTNPSDNPAAVVEQIADLNNLRTVADVVPGQTLDVPVR
ncbi:LysM domain-containing protein [Kribbella sp. NPDC051770]|uniref:LysM peptidoglycan-binding domain-containing protein n=1 Tax=Kribbella sp. NPDC051770 TaxID=3155413 RepID=UPI00342A3C34